MEGPNGEVIIQSWEVGRGAPREVIIESWGPTREVIIESCGGPT